MWLTREQEALLRGEYGPAVAKAMEIIVKVGEAIGAPRLVEVEHAHVSGVSYSNIGEYGLEFIRDFFAMGGRARVYTTINPGCVDYSGYSMIISRVYAEKQSDIDKYLAGMGFKPVFTCIPYYHRAPIAGEHLAWGESSAVIFANSIYGAMTNREGGPIALAAALTGYTYYAGMHEKSNRVARVQVNIPDDMRNKSYGPVGLWIGDNIKEVPLLRFRVKPSLWDIKILLASMAAAGSHALAVIPGVTPENSFAVEIEDRVWVEESDLEKYEGVQPAPGDHVLAYVGCPHLHFWELRMIDELVGRMGRPRRGKILVTIPFEYAQTYPQLVQRLISRGVDVAAGTCPVVSKLARKFDIVVTNSGKAAFYLSKIHGLRVSLRSLSEVVKSVY